MMLIDFYSRFFDGKSIYCFLMLKKLEKNKRLKESEDDLAHGPVRVELLEELADLRLVTIPPIIFMKMFMKIGLENNQSEKKCDQKDNTNAETLQINEILEDHAGNPFVRLFVALRTLFVYAHLFS